MIDLLDGLGYLASNVSTTIWLEGHLELVRSIVMGLDADVKRVRCR